ncbi:MAG TPA: hypothetical protein VHB49_04380 [Bradyrhizobium sp.]|nr:hypothetical protein [Bradyrhizobium sp.]
MADRHDFLSQANELRQQAEREPDEAIRARLQRMADHYVHLADSQAWSQAHPADAASLGEIFSKRD